MQMDFSQFFVSPEKLVPGSGFTLFGPFHITILLFIALFIFVFCCWYRKQTNVRQRCVLKHLAILTVVQEVIKDILIVAVGSPLIQYLPLHLCGLAMFFFFAAAWQPTPFVYELLYSLTLPGAIAALLFPNWTECPPMHFMCWHSFSFHTYLVLFVCLLLSTGQLRPNWKLLPRCFVFLIVLSIPIYFFNKLTDTNYMFLNVPSEGSPLVPLANLLGNPGYIAGTAALLILVWMIIYLPWTLIRIKNKTRI